MWIENIINPEGLNTIYKNQIPDLLNVTIIKLEFERSSYVILTIDLNDYPDTPPKKWGLENYNTVQIKILLSELISINLSKWEYDEKCSILMEKRSEDIYVRANGNCEFEMIVKFARINSISAYRQKTDVD